MAQTEHLPIYKAAYGLCLYFEQVVRNFSRYHKYSLGQDLRDGARRVLRLVVRANGRRDTGAARVTRRARATEGLLRLCQDVKAFPNFNAFECAITPVWRARAPESRPRGGCGALRAGARRSRAAAPRRAEVPAGGCQGHRFTG